MLPGVQLIALLAAGYLVLRELRSSGGVLGALVGNKAPVAPTLDQVPNATNALGVDLGAPITDAPGVVLGGKMAPVSGHLISPQEGAFAERGFFSSSYQVEVELYNTSAVDQSVLVELRVKYAWNATFWGDGEWKRHQLGTWTVPAKSVHRLKASVNTGNFHQGAFELGGVAQPVELIVAGSVVTTTWYLVK